MRAQAGQGGFIKVVRPPCGQAVLPLGLALPLAKGALGVGGPLQQGLQLVLRPGGHLSRRLITPCHSHRSAGQLR